MGKKRVADMTPEERERHREKDREYQRKYWARKTPEQKEQQRAKQRDYQRELKRSQRASETPEERESRLRRRRADTAAVPKEVRRDRHWKWIYGLSREQWFSLFAFQGSCCAICRSDDPGTRNGWSTDHDHVTGAVRGILCRNCNVTLGSLGDTRESVAEYAARMIRYLDGEKNPPEPLDTSAR